MRYVAFPFWVTLFILLGGCSHPIEDYPSAVRWKNTNYIGSGTFISKEGIKKEIGAVKGQIEGFPAKTDMRMLILKGALFLR
ncbi:hypothetical protein [Domibacillus indicus]|uniref:hypothetical protein n=1 Tax=Domibacillus indicus TaxID=1437523 RepID=UPI000617B722|nr:hypothetical protein [Domibacillus indicus]